jgi:hypothetical protein
MKMVSNARPYTKTQDTIVVFFCVFCGCSGGLFCCFSFLSHTFLVSYILVKMDSARTSSAIQFPMNVRQQQEANHHRNGEQPRVTIIMPREMLTTAAVNINDDDDDEDGEVRSYDTDTLMREIAIQRRNEASRQAAQSGGGLGNNNITRQVTSHGETSSRPRTSTTKTSAATCKRKRDPADDLICPITLELPLDPVMAADGRVYERDAIREHFNNATNGVVKSPFTNEKLDNTTLVAATQHRNTIETLIDTHVITGELADRWIQRVQENKDLLARARRGDVQALETVATNAYWRTNGFRDNDTVRYDWCKRLHDAGNPKGTAYLAFFHLHGVSVTVNPRQALVYLALAAAQGSNLAAYKLAHILACDHRSFELEQDVPQGLRLLERATSGACPHDHIPSHIKREIWSLLKTLRRQTSGS